MVAALISACVFAVAILGTAADSPFSVVGEGLLSKPFTVNGQPGRGMRYAGPVVYSNEKPPMIFFPPPPKDAKPGLGGLFSKNKSPKSIKYVPMPHHDLPVLIYTSDKMPPIHVVQPPQSNNLPQFKPPREEFRPPSGSLLSAYRGILPESTAPRIVTSSYEIPSTSYGTPMKPFGSSLGSLDLSPIDSLGTDDELDAYQPGPTLGQGLGLKPPKVQYANSNKKTPPHILYEGEPPIHVFNEPNMFVQAPKEIPLKTYADMPPKASFGPPKSFSPPSINSFAAAAPHSHHHRPHLATLRPPPYARPSSSFFPARENLISSASSQTPSAIQPCSSNNAAKVENKTPVSPSSQESFGRPPTYAFNPPQTMFSFGPFSIEYGPPSEPFMSYSEPTGSLSSFYGAMNEVESEKSNSGSTGASTTTSSSSSDISEMGDDGWMPGPLPDNAAEAPIKEEEAWDAPMPPPLPAYQPNLRPTPSFRGPRPNHMRSSVLLPSGPHGSFFGGSKLAQFLSAFKLKRSKPKYAIAPKSMHKPPIIIYYGKKPPIHVYQKPADEEYGSLTSASSASTVAVSSIQSQSSDGKTISNDNTGNSKEHVQSSSIDNVELTFGGSQNSEVRVAAPSSSSVPAANDEIPAIIPAKPVDISFSPSELQPSIYMARNTLNTILVSDISGSGPNTIKTYIMRNSEQGSQDSGSSSAESNGKSIPVAQNRISGEAVADKIPDTSAPVSQVDQVENATYDADNRDSSSNDNAPTIVYAIGSPSSKQESAEEETQSQASEQTRAIIQSPSSFQTSLSQAEKEAEEAVEASSS